MKPFTEKDILYELDKAYNNSNPLSIYESNHIYNETKDEYSFFFDLELPYTSVASSRIHLYSDSTYWAIVFEVVGCNIKEFYPEAQLVYIGNGIDYINNKDDLGNSKSNWDFIILSDIQEIESIKNKEGKDLELYRLIGKNVNTIKINDSIVKFKNDYKEFERKGISIRDYDNPQKLISFDNLIRYINETEPEILHINKDFIKKHFLRDLPKLMTIEKFHYTRNSIPSILPSQQELFQLIAKILVTKDTTLWKPTLPANNHWSNWESGIV